MINCLRIFSLLSLTLGFTADCCSQDKAIYPTEEEIQLLLSDTERAWNQFHPLIAEKHLLLARIGVEPPARRLLVTYSLDVVVPMVKHEPALFNTPEGFFLIESLFAESREAAVCSSTAWKQSKLAIATAKPELAREFEDLGQSCSDASDALYKVAENAGRLYQKYLKAESDANTDGVWVAHVLKKMEAIKPGMTRDDLLKVFGTEGGISTGLHRTFVSRDCAYFKVDVEFQAVGRPETDTKTDTPAISHTYAHS